MCMRSNMTLDRRHFVKSDLKVVKDGDDFNVGVSEFQR